MPALLTSSSIGVPAASRCSTAAQPSSVDRSAAIVSASPLPYYPNSQVPREMTRADMDAVRDAFAETGAVFSTKGAVAMREERADGAQAAGAAGGASC